VPHSDISFPLYLDNALRDSGANRALVVHPIEEQRYLTFFMWAKKVNSFFFLFASIFIVRNGRLPNHYCPQKRAQEFLEKCKDCAQIAFGCGCLERKRLSRMKSSQSAKSNAGWSVRRLAAQFDNDAVFFKIRYNLVEVTSRIFYLVVLNILGDIMDIHSSIARTSFLPQTCPPSS